MKTLAPLCLPLLLPAASALGQDGSFENNFAPITMSAGQATMAGPGVASAPGGGVTTGGAGGAPTYVNPTATQSATRPDQTRQKPQSQQQSGSNGNQTPQMPQLPSGGGGQKGQQGGGSGGGGCKSCGQNLQKSTDKLQQDLTSADPKDGQTQKLINTARDTVTNAQKTEAGLNNADGKLGQAREQLDQAAEQIGQQNTQNQQDIQKLQTAQTQRQQVISQAKPGDTASTPPSCSPSGGASTYGPGDTSQVEQADNGIHQGQSLQSSASQIIGQMGPVVAAIGSAVAPVTTLAVTSVANLGGGSVQSAMQDLSRVYSDAQVYLAQSRGAGDLAGQAVQKTQAAHDASLQTARDIKEANTKAQEADRFVKQQCEKINSQDKAAWQAADALDEPAKTTGKQAAVTSATTSITQMGQKQTEMAQKIQQLTTEQQQAQSKLQDAKTAIQALAKKLGS